VSFDGRRGAAHVIERQTAIRIVFRRAPGGFDRPLLNASQFSVKIDRPKIGSISCMPFTLVHSDQEGRLVRPLVGNRPVLGVVLPEERIEQVLAGKEFSRQSRG